MENLLPTKNSLQKPQHMHNEDLTADLLSGKIVKNHIGEFYFDSPGNWISSGGFPDKDRLHRTRGAAAMFYEGNKCRFEWWRHGNLLNSFVCAINHD